MARLYQNVELKRTSRGSVVRLAVFAFVALFIVISASSVLSTPFLQIYWGAAGRLKSSGVATGANDMAEIAGEADATKLLATKPDNKAAVMPIEEPPVTATPAKDTATSSADPKEPAGGVKTDTAVKSEETALSAKHRLTQEYAEKAATTSDGSRVPVVVTWANFHYKDFVMNWVEHLQATGCTNLLVGAMDDDLLQILLDASIPAFAMSSGLTLGDFGWGSSTFNKMGREKISLIQTFTKWGIDVIISDVDTVWLQNPIDYMQQYPKADVLTSSDHLEASTDDGGLEDASVAHSAANIGIMLFRPSAAELADDWVKILDKDPKLWDQNVFNELMHQGGVAPVESGDRLFSGYNGKLTFGILPVSMFCSGHTYFVQRMPDTLGLPPYVVHATFQFSGTPGKRNRFREHLLFNDPPEYFKHPVGWISVANDIPQDLKTAVETVNRDGRLDSTHPHFDLVNHQLVTLRALFAMATALGRGVVLPELWCGFDRWWAPHKGIIPGSNFETPFRCPADHVLDLEMMSSTQFGEGEFGKHIDWRESSFLENPRAEELRSSVLTVRTCGPDGEGPSPPEGVTCADGSGPAATDNAEVWLQHGRSEAEIQAALAEFSSEYSVIHFEDAKAAWGGFSDEEIAKKFKKRLDMYGSLWCCVEGHPGHIWYDFFWDSGPHTDRHNRQIGPGKWMPRTGP